MEPITGMCTEWIIATASLGLVGILLPNICNVMDPLEPFSHLSAVKLACIIAALIPGIPLFLEFLAKECFIWKVFWAH